VCEGMSEMLNIDGMTGEGGGQVLRTALGLSVVTQTPFAIDKIRAGRKKPGLQRQHLTGVLAAARVGCAHVEGAAIGSTSLTFTPSACNGGTYEFAINSAGSTGLVLQTVLPALWAADSSSTVTITGGTHNPMAPPFDFLKKSFAPVMHRMGAGLELQLDRHGFYPAGGGKIRARIAPASWSKLDLLDAPGPAEVTAQILSSSLHPRVSDRECKSVRRAFDLRPSQVDIIDVDAAGPGNAVMINVQLGRVEEVVTQMGERGVLAEHVASRAVQRAKSLIDAKVSVGEHLADQLLIPMAMAGGGAFRTCMPTLHTQTNAQIIEMFLPVKFSMREDEAAGNWVIEVQQR
jgi:RNA 3'-terminal phosphate cyclase (ATP)